MQSFQFQTVAHLIAGYKSLGQLEPVLKRYGSANVLIVTDGGMLAHALHLPLIELLQRLSLNYVIYSDIQADPTVEMVQHAATFAQQQQIDLVIGFGGGSPMDVAKLIALLAHPQQQQPLAEMYGVNQVQGPRLPLVLIPTTAGTGSEVTPIAIVTTGQTTKTGIVSPQLYADVAVIDAQFTLNLPAHITAATGIDAMVHAIEAYTSQHKKNPYSDLLAKQALVLLHQNLSIVMQNPKDAAARQNMLFGAMLAGQAFANAPVAAVHALAYPLGGRFHLSHGHSNAVVLVEVLKYNAPMAKTYYAELMHHLLAHDPASTQNNAHDEDILCEQFIACMQQHLLNSGLALTLKPLGIQSADLAQLASDAMQQTRLLQNNPRPMTEAAALAIYQAIYE